jgi:molybdate transport repressor ModE-like protein/molybdopterin-binding protein
MSPAPASRTSRPPRAGDAFDAEVVTCEPQGSIAWLRIGRARVAARLWPGLRAGQRVVVRLSPHDVVLCLAHPGPTSARNVLPGHVVAARHVPEGVYVTLDVGFPLVALVTRRAVDELGLRRGTPVFALLKATAIGPHVDFDARVAISLRGARGALDAGSLDFLRAVERSGSLSEAGRRSGVTYRTAWARAQHLNRTWGRPLVARVHGGKGGGGTTLTAEGHAALEYADAVLRALGEQVTPARTPGTRRRG